MIRVLRSEWIKFRTIRMNHVLVILAIAFPLIVVVLTAALMDVDEANAKDLAGLVTGTSVITGMLLGVIGAASITGEFGFGTIRPTFAATPKRMRVVAAKTIVTVVVALVTEALVVVLSYGIGSAILTSRDATLDLGAPAADGATEAMLGVVLFAAIVSLLGLGLGLVIRSTPASVAVLILWPLVAELLIGGLLHAAGVEHPFKWLPYNEGINLGNPDARADAESLGRLVGGLYFFSVAAAITVIGSIVTTRRDA
ncbi:MAG: ABC transporter permease [Actinobacteria bacterium]|nr:ABC transporter permease [Actinomycetota bacterium]